MTDALSSTLSAVADPTRRAILQRLREGDATVKELARPFDMSLAAVSKHLDVLERAGLISRRKQAQFRHCHLEPEPLAEAWRWLQDYRDFWDRSFESLGEYVKMLAPAGSASGRKRSKRKP